MTSQDQNIQRDGDRPLLETPAVANSGPMKIIKIEPSSATGALQEREITLQAPRMDTQDITQSLPGWG